MHSSNSSIFSREFGSASKKITATLFPGDGAMVSLLIYVACHG